MGNTRVLEPNTIGEDHMLQGYKLREMRKESLRQWRLIHLNLKLWNIKHGRTTPIVKEK